MAEGFVGRAVGAASGGARAWAALFSCRAFHVPRRKVGGATKVRSCDPLLTRGTSDRPRLRQSCATRGQGSIEGRRRGGGPENPQRSQRRSLRGWARSAIPGSARIVGARVASGGQGGKSLKTR